MFEKLPLWTQTSLLSTTSWSIIKSFLCFLLSFFSSAPITGPWHIIVLLAFAVNIINDC